MSFMDHNTAFATAGGIQELSVDEVRQVQGGWAWALFGGIAGGLQQYAERSDDGDMTVADWAGVAGGADLGALGGRVVGGGRGGGGGLIAYVEKRLTKKK